MVGPRCDLRTVGFPLGICDGKQCRNERGKVLIALRVTPSYTSSLEFLGRVTMRSHKHRRPSPQRKKHDLLLTAKRKQILLVFHSDS